VVGQRWRTVDQRRRFVVPNHSSTAHNVPVSNPSYLEAPRDVTHAITSGTVAGTRDGALVTFTLEGFTIQIPASPSAH
jgi:hypothetical protein